MTTNAVPAAPSAPPPPAPDARVDTRTTTANSAVIVRSDRQAIVELDPNHPGFRDHAYRERRNKIAQVAVEYVTGTLVPDVEYAPEEHGVWRAIWAELGPAHAEWACRQYLKAVQYLDFPADRIPQLAEVSKKVEALTGFRLEPIGGLVHPRVFLSALGDGVFLSTQYIRHASTPLYTPEPDVVHELVGHAGTLAEPKLAELNRLVGTAAKRTRDDAALDVLGRIYWYTLEFGVLRENGAVKAYGAGLLSSFGELANLARVRLMPLDFAHMEATPYDVTKYQPHLYCAESFDHLYTSLKAYLDAWDR